MKAVIFDMDGTLIDSVDLHARAWQEALQHFGREVPFEEVRSQIGKGGDQLLPHFFGPEEMERIGGEIQRYRKQLFKEKYHSQVRPFPQVRELFEHIRAAGLKTALATSSPEDELRYNKRLVKIEDLVDAEATADDADRSKPHPDIFLATLEKLEGVEAREVIAVGDTPYDAEAAGKSGLRTLGFLSGGFPERDLLAAGCIAIYQDPADLLYNLSDSPLTRA